MNIAEALVEMYGYPLWFAGMIGRYFPRDFAATGGVLKEYWRSMMAEQIERAREALKSEPMVAGFMKPCLTEEQLVAFAEKAGQADNRDFVIVHCFFCPSCQEKKHWLLWEQMILEGIASLRSGHCPDEFAFFMTFGHLHHVVKNPDVTGSPYRRINYPEFMILGMDHLNQCGGCQIKYKKLERECDAAENEDKILAQIEQQLGGLPSQ